jgi:indole-3-glycerol phosphate synthase
MSILNDILVYKKREVSQKKVLLPLTELEKSIYYDRIPFSLKKQLQQVSAPGIIAEFKRKSPSRGVINDTVHVKDVTSGYAEAGATGLSILTDKEFFGGNFNDLIYARKRNSLPILRKDFIIDEYQAFEAKAIGADVILLIAAILTTNDIKKITDRAHSLQMEVILELHDQSETEKITPDVDIIGVNNRDLNTFEVNINRSLEMAAKLDPAFVKIAESGLSKPATVQQLFEAGFKGFLIGETFMKTKNPAKTCGNFIKKIS